MIETNSYDTVCHEHLKVLTSDQIDQLTRQMD